MARGESDRFQASCSMVSSNTHACPGTHCSRFAADSETAIRRHDQRQMDCQPCIGNAGMRRYRRACIENGKENGGRARSHVAQRRRLEGLHGQGTTRHMRRLLDALIGQKVGTPAPRLIEFSPSIERNPVGIGDIGFKARAIRHQNCRELAANFLGRGFDGVQPRKLTARSKNSIAGISGKYMKVGSGLYRARRPVIRSRQ